MVLTLWVPDTQVLLARNWNSASPGSAFTAFSVAKSALVSTPLRMGRSVVVLVLMVVPFVGDGAARTATPGQGWKGSGAGRVRRREGGPELEHPSEVVGVAP